MQKVFYFIIFLYLFLGANVLQFLGWNFETVGAPFFELLFPSFFLILLLVFSTYREQSFSFYKQKKEEIFLFIFLVIMIAFQLIRDQNNFLATAINCLFMPVLVSFIVPVKKNMCCREDVRRKLKKMVLVFFVMECSIAILERLLEVHIFPMQAYDGTIAYGRVDSDMFRSTALQNHPLQNALIVSIIMGFILMSNAIDVWKKYLLWGMGYLALLSFNTRSSIFGWILLFGVYIIYLFFRQKKVYLKERIILVVFTFFSISSILFLIFDYRWGGRLLEFGMFSDESSEVRLQVFDIFLYYDYKHFLWGVPSLSIDRMASSIGVEIVENYWLMYVFTYGIIFVLILIFLFAKLFSRLFKEYGSFHKFFLLSSFILISSTNNSLSSGTAALGVFILCAYIFNPKIDR